MIDALIQAVVAGLVGGVITGSAAFAAIRVELRYLRRDVDDHHTRLRALESARTAG